MKTINQKLLDGEILNHTNMEDVNNEGQGKVSKLKKFWAILNGNKTIIGSIVLAVLQYMPIPEPYKAVSIGVVSILTGAALTSHIQKGFFRADKGQ